MLPLLLFTPSVLALLCLGAYIQRRVHRYRVRVWVEADLAERGLAGELMLYVAGPAAWSRGRTLTASHIPRRAPRVAKGVDETGGMA